LIWLTPDDCSFEAMRDLLDQLGRLANGRHHLYQQLSGAFGQA